MRNLRMIPFALALMGFCSCNHAGSDPSDPADSIVKTETKREIKVTDSSKGSIYPDTLSYGINSSSPRTAALVSETLKGLFKTDLQKNLVDSNSRKFIFFEYDLNGDGKKEIFVGLSGTYFCGSGGCTLYILDDQGRPLSKFTVAEIPVVIDSHRTHEWNDLFIFSGGKFHIVQFNGKKYPMNPSLQPVLKLLPGDGLPRALNFPQEPYRWFEF